MEVGVLETDGVGHGWVEIGAVGLKWMQLG